MGSPYRIHVGGPCPQLRMMLMSHNALNLELDDFLRRARAEAERYGEDRWVFLRELVQNSRDALASQFDCQVWDDGQTQTICCTDNGVGMPPAHLEPYLFRLYASDKETNHHSLGCFGVGFWSVLLFEPDEIRVASRTPSQETVSFCLDLRHLSITKGGADLAQPGFQVTLTRANPSKSPRSLTAAVRQKLQEHAGPVQPAQGVPELVLLCEGERVNTDMPQPEFMGRRLHARGFEAIIGFGSQPRVHLYKSGLLVRSCSHFSELVPKWPQRKDLWHVRPFPQVSLDVSRLNVLLDRRSVFEDSDVLATIQRTEKALIRLQRNLVTRHFPLNPVNAGRWLARRYLHGRRPWVWLSLTTLTLLFLIAVFHEPNGFWPHTRPSMPAGPHAASIQGGGLPAASPWVSMDYMPELLSRPIVDGSTSPTILWDLSVTGLDRMTIQVGALGEFDPEKGLLPSHLSPVKPPTFARDPNPPLTVTMRTQGRRSTLVLPFVPGHALSGEPRWVDGGGSFSLGMDAWGQPLLTSPNAIKGTLQYGLSPKHPTLPTPENTGSFPTQWPPPVEAFLATIKARAPEEQVQRVAEFLGNQLSYSRAARAEDAMETPGTPFTVRVFQNREGDCDVLNAVNALMLRALGIPAYVAVGLVGDGENWASELHAWTCYYHEGWKEIDISTITSHNAGNHGRQPALDPPDPSTARPLFSENAPMTWLPATPWVLAATGLLILGLWWRWNRTYPRSPDETGHSEALFRDLFRNLSASSHPVKDPLGLRFRPMITTVSGKRLSLDDLERASARGPLMGAESPLPPHIGPRPSSLIQRSDPMVKALEPHLPPILWLDTLMRHPILPLPQPWPDLERQLKRFQPHLRLHTLAHVHGVASWRVGRGPFRAPLNHVAVGLNTPGLPSTEGPLFPLLEWLLDRCALFAAEKDRWLTEYAQQTLNQPISNSQSASTGRQERHA